MYGPAAAAAMTATAEQWLLAWLGIGVASSVVERVVGDAMLMPCRVCNVGDHSVLCTSATSFRARLQLAAAAALAWEQQ